MVKRFTIILAEIVAIAIAIVTGVLFWASWYVDTDEFQSRFIQVVELGTGCPAELRGELNIALYPYISLEILGLDVNDPDDPEVPLASFETIRVSARLMPLLSRKLEFRTILVDGVQANIVKASDGSINWEALVKQEAVPTETDVQFDADLDDISLSGLEVHNAVVSYVDMTDNDRLELRGIDLRTGEIRVGESVPFTASSQFGWQDGGIESKIILKGRLEATDSQSVRLADATLYASVEGPFLPEGASPGELSANVVVDGDTRVVSLDHLHLRFLGVQAEGRFVSGDLGEDISGKGRLEVSQFSPGDIISRYAPHMPVSAVDGLRTSHLKTLFSFDESGISFNELSCSLDELTVTGAIAMKGFNDPRFTFDLKGGLVDLDRYLPLFDVSDEPFYWGDYPLELFRDFRGNGKAQAAGFKVLDQTLLDIQATGRADGKNIVIDAKAKTEASESLTGKGVFTIGKTPETGVPTLAANLSLNGVSPKSGFALLNIDPLAVDGRGRITARLGVKTIECPPKGRSIEILKNIDTEFNLVQGKGRGVIALDDSYDLDFDKAEWAFKASSIPVKRDLYYGFWVDSTIRGSGMDTFRAFSVSTKGAVTTAVDELHFIGSNLQTRSSASGRWYNGKSNRATTNGIVEFDTQKDTLSVKNATVRAFETTARGSLAFSDLSKSFKATGDLDLPGVNIRRLVYLLAGKRLKTQDSEALKSLKLSTRVALGEKGFQLDDLAGELDGMPITGIMRGVGYNLPDLRFELNAGNFDLDRYLPPSRKPTIEELRAGKVEKTSPVDLPLDFLRSLKGNGSVQFDSFKLVKIRTENLRGNILADKGKIHVSNVTGKLYEGSLKGDWTGDVGRESLMTRLKLSTRDIQAGLLMVDLAKRDYVRGKTDMDFDLIGHGRTDDDIVKTLGGKVDVSIGDGSYKFTGYNAKPPVRSHNDSTESILDNDPRRRRTAFSKAEANFAVKRGKFNVRKFTIDASPILMSHGQGWFDIAKNSIDLSIRNDFVAVPSVTVTLKGKLTDPAIHVPKGKILDDTVRNILSLPEKSFKFLRDILPF